MSSRIYSLSFALLLGLMLSMGLASASWGGAIPCNNNGVTEAPEECDDANTVPDDGCDFCVLCGNGTVAGNEECDDGNSVDDDDCSNICQSNCGNGMVDANSTEECDDGNTVDGDACSNACLENICGNGRVDVGEECDDGNTIDDDECNNMCMLTVVPMAQTKGQGKCIDKQNKAYAKVQKAQDKDNDKCLKDFGKGKVTDANACVVADGKGKVAKAEGKVISDNAKNCGDPDTPDFAYNPDTTAGNDAVTGESLALLADMFGADLNAAFVTKAADKDGASCQTKVYKAALKVHQTVWKNVIKTKKNSIKKDPQATTAADVEADLAALATDPKLAKAVAKVADAIAKCKPADVTPYFPGAAGAAGGATQAICRAVEGLNVTDQFNLDPNALVAPAACL